MCSSAETGETFLVFFCVVSLTHSIFFNFSIADKADYLTLATPLADGDTLVSSGGVVKFELGFFSPTNNSSTRYLGIWYKQDPKIVVWVANRDNPITGVDGVLRISGDGQLVITLNQTQNVLWSSNSSKLARNPRAHLLETGNFVVMNESSSVSSESYIWQSFDHPTDTWLPGGRVGRGLNHEPETYLTSWKSPDNPSSGDFVYRFIYRGLPDLVIDKGAIRKCRTGPWNGVRFSGGISLDITSSFVLNFHYNMLYNLYMPYNSSFITRAVIGSSGLYYWYLLDEVGYGWNLLYTVPHDPCENYGRCGVNGICSVMRQSYCYCLKGFTPKVPQKWGRLDWSDGCVRRVPLNCTRGDGFFKVVGVKLPDLLEFWLDTSLSLKQCEVMCLNNCSCTAYANSDISKGGSGCLLWFGDLIDVTEFNQEDSQQEIYIRLSASELESVGHVKKKRTVMVTAFSAAAGLLIFCLLVWCSINRKRRNMKGEDLLTFNPKASMSASKEEQNGVKRIGTNTELETPLFSFSSVSAAANNFSLSNKLGEGGFGPVYKGNLLNGEEVAIKRLSTRSNQGSDELKNEAVLIAKLQHKNLVRLFGCCIERDEHLLIYEYLPNKSLDLFLFDSAKHSIIDWMTRVKIIEGIAQGLLYLHHYSRLTIIHRDLKASNILLDKDMNPKISDFGLARIYGGNQQGATNRIVGTYGYMAPEYALEGIFSDKSDVFSFGILLLEILSGRRNTSFYRTDFLNLLGYAWDLWTREETLELKDPNLEETCGGNADSVLFTRYVHVALLCVQQHPAERPTMSEVVMMLYNEQHCLLPPKQPAFSVLRTPVDPSSHMSKCEADNCSVNLVTTSIVEAR